MATAPAPSAPSSTEILSSAVSGPGAAAGSADTTPTPPANAASGPSNPARQADTAALVRELFHRAREARRSLTRQWKRNYIALNNRAYSPGNNAWDEDPSVANIWPTIASAVAWMTDQRPIVEVTPSSEPYGDYWDWYQQLAVNMNTCLNASFTTYGLTGEITKALWDVHTYGVGWFKTQWEAPLAEGLGDATFRRVDPFTLYPDPHARDASECTYIIEVRTMTVDDADRSWPGAKRKLGFGEFTEDSDAAPHRLDDTTNSNTPRAAIGPLAPSTTVQSHGPGSPQSRYRDMPVVTILECYVRGHLVTPTDDPSIHHVTDEWRCIVVAGNTVLMDESCDDVNAFPSHPYDRVVLFDTGEMYGPCIVELLTPVQRVINWLLGAVSRNIYLMGNPVLREDPRAASFNKRFTNRPGQRVTGTSATLDWLSPPQMHPQMAADIISYYESKIETISGLSAMQRGFTPTGRNAQGVLDSVQDAAFVRVRASLRELERALAGVTTKMAATVAEFYTEPRLMSIIGEDGQRTHLAFEARHFYTLHPDPDQQRVPLRFSLLADVGSQLPTSKQARAAEAKHLFTIGGIDVYELLKAMQWPNYALVAQRVMEQQALAAQAPL